jgi:hypothetical protein
VIEYYSRKQKRITRSTFVAELRALVDSLEIGKLVCYAVCELMVPRISVLELLNASATDQLAVRIAACIDAKSVFDALTKPETRQPTEASLILVLMQVKELLRQRLVRDLYWISTEDMLADGLNKGTISREALLKVCHTAVWELLYPFEWHTEPHAPSAQDENEPLSTVEEFLKEKEQRPKDGG